MAPTYWDADRWPNFTASEMACRHCGALEMDPIFMDWLQRLRDLCRFPLPVSSGYRCPEHNLAVSTTGVLGPHTTGLAADIEIAGAEAYRLIAGAQAFAVMGIGYRQHGPRDRRFVHLDRVERGTPLVTWWSYP